MLVPLKKKKRNVPNAAIRAIKKKKIKKLGGMSKHS